METRLKVSDGHKMKHLQFHKGGGVYMHLPFLVISEGGICSCTSSIPPLDDATPNDEDVLQEENKVKRQATELDLDPNIAVQIRGLAKTYPGTTNIGCCKCHRTSPYHAVKVMLQKPNNYGSLLYSVPLRRKVTDLTNILLVSTCV